MEKENGMKKMRNGAIVVIIIMVGLFLFDKGYLEAPTTTEPETLSTPANSITLSSQYAGNEILLDRVFFINDGYVVIHKNNDGSPGGVMGRSDLLSSGASFKVYITTTESLVVGEDVFVMLHNDDGDGEYNFPGSDNPLFNSEGGPLMVRIDVIEGEREITDDVMEEGGVDEMIVEDEEVMEDTPAQTEENKIITVTYSDAGYDPRTIEISLGTTVRFVNESTRNMWVASARHPSHTVYPELDQLKGVSTGGIYEFTFNQAGTWFYHNHLHSSRTGTVIVN